MDIDFLFGGDLAKCYSYILLYRLQIASQNLGISSHLHYCLQWKQVFLYGSELLLELIHSASLVICQEVRITEKVCDLG